MLKRGPKRQADAILMSIHALILEFEVTLRRRENISKFEVGEFIGKLKSTWHYGNKFVPKVWEDCVTEMQRKVERMYQSYEKELAERKERKEEGLQRWS